MYVSDVDGSLRDDASYEYTWGVLLVDFIYKHLSNPPGNWQQVGGIAAVRSYEQKIAPDFYRQKSQQPKAGTVLGIPLLQSLAFLGQVRASGFRTLGKRQ